MSVHLVSWAWKQFVGDARAKLVLIKLADQANDDGICWPSQKTLGRETEMPRPTLQRRLDLLAHKLLIAVVLRPGRSNVYHVNPPQGEAPSEIEVASPGEAEVASPGEAENRKEPLGPLSPNGESASARLEHLWEAIEAEGIIAPAARSPRAAFAKLVRELADVAVSPDEVHRAAVAYREHRTLGETTLTLAALAKWMPQMLAESRPKEDLAADRLRKRMAEVLG